MMDCQNNSHFLQSGCTPFLSCCLSGQTEIVEFLLEINPDGILDRDDVSFSFFFHHFSKAHLFYLIIQKGNTGLRLACIGGHEEIIDILLSSSANVMAKQLAPGDTLEKNVWFSSFFFIAYYVVLFVTFIDNFHFPSGRESSPS